MEIPWAATCLPFLLAAAIWTSVFFSAAAKANDPTGHPWAAKAIVGLGRAVAVLVALAAAAADCRSHDAEEGVAAAEEKLKGSDRDRRLLFFLL